MLLITYRYNLVANHSSDQYYMVLFFRWIPWVPEASRGPICDLPAEGRPMSAEGRLTNLTEAGNRARQTSGTQGIRWMASNEPLDSYDFNYFPQYLQFAFANHNHCELFTRTRVDTRKDSYSKEKFWKFVL